MSAKTRHLTVLVVFYLLVAAALVTLLPYPGPKANDFGYASLCPFAPWSTLVLLVVAGLVWAVRQYLVTLPE